MYVQALDLLAGWLPGHCIDNRARIHRILTGRCAATWFACCFPCAASGSCPACAEYVSRCSRWRPSWYKEWEAACRKDPWEIMKQCSRLWHCSLSTAMNGLRDQEVVLSPYLLPYAMLVVNQLIGRQCYFLQKWWGWYMRTSRYICICGTLRSNFWI